LSRVKLQTVELAEDDSSQGIAPWACRRQPPVIGHWDELALHVIPGIVLPDYRGNAFPDQRCDERNDRNQGGHPVSAGADEQADGDAGEPHLPPEVTRVEHAEQHEATRHQNGVYDLTLSDLRETERRQDHQQGGNDIPEELRGIRAPPIRGVQRDVFHVPSSFLRTAIVQSVCVDIEGAYQPILVSSTR